MNKISSSEASPGLGVYFPGSVPDADGGGGGGGGLEFYHFSA